MIAHSLSVAARRLFGADPCLADGVTTLANGEYGTRPIIVGNQRVFATCRRHALVGEREAFVLSALSNAGAPVPDYLGFSNGWMFAAAVDGENLGDLLRRKAPCIPLKRLTAALDSLQELQSVGRELGLVRHVAYEDISPAAASRALSTLAALGQASSIGKPPWQEKEYGAATQLLVHTPADAFIKCDSKPANAAVRPDGRVYWFDWEHARVGRPSEDYLRAICDEDAVPSPELYAIVRSRANVSDDYLSVAAVVYVSRRALLALREGVGAVERWATHGRLWAAGSPITSSLTTWFDRLAVTAGSDSDVASERRDA